MLKLQHDVAGGAREVPEEHKRSEQLASLGGEGMGEPFLALMMALLDAPATKAEAAGALLAALRCPGEALTRVFANVQARSHPITSLRTPSRCVGCRRGGASIAHRSIPRSESDNEHETAFVAVQVS